MGLIFYFLVHYFRKTNSEDCNGYGCYCMQFNLISNLFNPLFRLGKSSIFFHWYFIQNTSGLPKTLDKNVDRQKQKKNVVSINNV